jgi:hypothetical protein
MSAAATKQSRALQAADSHDLIRVQGARVNNAHRLVRRRLTAR